MRKLFLAVCVVSCINTIAQTSVPAGAVNGVWTLAGSPYQIQGNILILKDSTLTIQPGVTVEFQGYYKFNIQGRLLAVGTAVDTITFTAANIASGWKGIRFDNTPTSNDTSKIQYCKIQYGIATGASPDNCGGGLYFYSASKVIVSNSRIQNCKANRGAAMYFNYNNCSPIIKNNVIIGNTNDSEGGGAIFCEGNSSPLIRNNLITQNSAVGAGGYGGGITCAGGSPTIDGNTITNNTTQMNGGGINLSSSNAKITNNIITNNSATNLSGFGGGVYCGSIDFPVFSGNTISNNTALNGGAFFFTAASNAALSENVICNNTASSNGGAIYCTYSAIPIIRNTTITNNDASNGGALYCTGSSAPIFKNTIIYGNTASVGGSQVYLDDDASDPNFYYCDIQGGSAAFDANGNYYSGTYENNINSNPLFIAPSNGSGQSFDGTSADWSIASSSPCVDAGDPNGTTSTLDKASNARVNVCRMDIGAYEYQKGIPFDIAVNIARAIPCYNATGDIEVTINSGTPSYSYLWSDGQTTAKATGLVAGNYTVTVTQLGDGCTLTKTIALADNSSTNMSPDAGNDQTIICGGAVQINLALTPIGMESQTFTFKWEPSTGLDSDAIYNPTSSVTSDTKYVVTVTASGGCVKKDSVTIFVNPLTVDAGNNKTIICGGSEQIMHVVSNYSGAGSLTYSWVPSAGLNDDAIGYPIASPIIDTKYYITVTTANGCSAIDSMLVDVNPLIANAGNDKTIICGGAISLDQVTSNYTGAGVLTYSWSPTNGLDSSTIPNPIADTTTTTNYVVTVTTPNGCSAIDSAKVFVNPLIANAGNDKTIICDGLIQLDNVSSNYTGVGNLTYSWLPATGLDDPTIVNPVATMIHDTRYKVTISTPNGCTAVDSVDVIVSPLTASGTDASYICGQSTGLNITTTFTGTTALTYSWLPTSGLDNPSVANPIASGSSNQSYTVTATTLNGCLASDAVTVSIDPMNVIPICIVGVDSTNKNRVVWNKPASTSIDSFYIYRETNTTDIYQKTGVVSYADLSVFVDENSSPDVQSNKYKISILDNCGLESAMSDYHKTMHLTINKGLGNTWNLIWENYAGFVVSTYNVYRGTTPDNLQQIGSSSGANTQFTDLNPPSEDVYYQVEIISPNQCNPTRSYDASRSNIATNKITGINNLEISNVINVHPNPAHSVVNVTIDKELFLGEILYVELMDVTTQFIYKMQVPDFEFQINISDISPGLYFLKVYNKNVFYLRRFVIE